MDVLVIGEPMGSRGGATEMTLSFLSTWLYVPLCPIISVCNEKKSSLQRYFGTMVCSPLLGHWAWLGHLIGSAWSLKYSFESFQGATRFSPNNVSISSQERLPHQQRERMVRSQQCLPVHGLRLLHWIWKALVLRQEGQIGYRVSIFLLLRFLVFSLWRC